MQGQKPPTFRPTVWPAEPPTPPPVTRYDVVPVNGEEGLEVKRVLGTFDLPPDFVFRELLEKVPTSVADVVDLTAEWGLACPAGEGAFDYFGEGPWAPIQQDLARWGQTPRMVPLLHPDAVLMHLDALRKLAGHLLAHLEGRDDDAIIAGWTQRAPRDVDHAWWLWERYINRGLAIFSVHVRAEPTIPGAVRLTRPTANLYNAACLQLVHYLAGDKPVLRCANVRCGRPFTRQRGRAREEYGQHRSRGVRYCSHLCAKAQSERDRRRRRATEATQ